MGPSITPGIQNLSIKGEPFQFVKERRNGTQLYRAENGSAYARVGTPELIQKELDRHTLLLSAGFPIPPIVEHLQSPDRGIFIEGSLGILHLADHFIDEMARNGRCSDTTFSELIGVCARFSKAQVGSAKPSATNATELFAGTYFDTMLTELPEFSEVLGRCMSSISIALSNTPLVLTHGDFNPFNIFSSGVIDFEDLFLGPLGYDLLSPLSHHLWFPVGSQTEIPRAYHFTPEQNQKYLTTVVDPLSLSAESLSASFLMKATWSTAKMHQVPKLQQWRYIRYRALCTDFLNGVNIFTRWIEGGYD